MRPNLLFSAILIMISFCVSARAQSDVDRDNVIEKVRSDMNFYLSKCPMSSMSNVDRTECLQKQVNIAKSKMNFALKKEYNMAESYAVNRDPNDAEVIKIIKSLKNDIKKSQSAWQGYNKKQCDAVVNSYEIRGGTGGAADMLECQLRLSVLRLYELSLTGAMRE